MPPSNPVAGKSRPARGAPHPIRSPIPSGWLRHAEQQHRAGRLEQAEALYRRILGRQSRHAPTLHRLAVLLMQQHHWSEAVELLQEAVAVLRNPPHQRGLQDVCFDLGNALFALHRYPEAIEVYREALDQAPDDAELHNNLANALVACHRPAAAITHYRQALAGMPHEAGIRINLSDALQREGRGQDAVDCLMAALRQAPPDAEFCFRIAAALERLHQHQAAADGYRGTLSLNPDHPEAAYRLGIHLQRHGRFEEAADWLDKALAGHRDFVEARCALLAGRGYRADPADIQALEQLLRRPELKLEQRCRVHFTLGKVHDRRDETDSAWEHIRAGNQLRVRQRPFDPSAHRAYIERIMRCCDRTLFAQCRDYGSPDTRPVFIIGMPRSGTTLVEQILASHEQFHGAGERDTMRRLVRELPALLGGREAFPECLPLLDRETSRHLARSCLEPFQALPETIRRIADKLPGNYVRLGLIALLFPNARVIHCRRDPLDTCLSCYFSDFARGQSYSYRLDHLAEVYLDYRRLMNHWQQVLPLPVFPLDYERLIAAPQRTVATLLDFCELPWDGNCLSFHRTEREIGTLSYREVRQPLYTHAINRWQRYRTPLHPLINRFEQHGLCHILNIHS